MAGNAPPFIIEFYKLGNSVKVSAIDPVTTKEASVIAPTNLSKNAMAELAIRKLKYILAK